MYQRKEITDYPNYRIDTNGDVWSCWRRVQSKAVIGDEWHKLKPFKTKWGYALVRLCNGILPNRGISVHSLVLKAFIGMPEKGYEANHKNGIKDDNRLENPEWCTRAENQIHAIKTGLKEVIKGDKASWAKLTSKQVRVIKWALHYGCAHIFLAKAVGVGRASISQIARGKNWKHITI